METASAVSALSALAHPTRLAVFRLLVSAGAEGVAAGEIARRTGTLPNTLSSSLSILAAAGLARSRREGRSIVYSAAYDRMGELLTFLVEDCCGGDLAACGPVAEALTRVQCGAPSPC